MVCWKSFRPLLMVIVGGCFWSLGLAGCHGRLLGESEDPVMESEDLGQPKKVFNCDATEEFLTTITYLRHKKVLGLADQDMRAVATEVSGGCHGAAGRFIMVTELLLKAGVDGRSALLVGEEYAHEDGARTEAFRDLFRHSFVPSGLDLAPPASIALAQRLLKSVRQPPEALADEFEELVGFCVRHKGLDLSRPQCAELVTSILVSAPPLVDCDLPGTSESFIEAYTFLTNNEGPHLTTRDALTMAQRLAAISPYATFNFIEAYGFAVAPKGMGLDRSQGVRFAMELAEKTVGQMTGVTPGPRS